MIYGDNKWYGPAYAVVGAVIGALLMYGACKYFMADGEPGRITITNPTDTKELLGALERSTMELHGIRLALQGLKLTVKCDVQLPQEDAKVKTQIIRPAPACGGK